MITRVRPERRGTTPNGTPIRLGAVTATNTTPPRGQKAKVHKGAGGGCRGLGGTPVLGSAATVHATAGTKAGTVLEHQPTFPRPCMKLHLCAVHGEMYLYTYVPNASSAKKRVFVYHFGGVCICCANQGIVTPVLYVPKVFPTTLSLKGVMNALTLCRFNRKHLDSTITVGKQNRKMRSIEAES